MEDRTTICPHEKLKAKYRVNTLLIFFLLIFPFVFLGLIPELGWLYVAIFVAANILWLVPVLLAFIPAYWRSLEYELLDDEVMVRKGVITKTVDVVPYNMITNISIKRGPVDRWLGIGGLAIHTAGYSQSSAAEASLVGLVDYEPLHEKILSAVREHRVGGPKPAMEGASLEEASATDLLARILEELQALRRNLNGQE
ncbi:MAG: PH domain-containing protein [Chloroflexota bacterium]|nr:PH domain-containing protein [Chloroflexota bacterium]